MHFRHSLFLTAWLLQFNVLIDAQTSTAPCAAVSSMVAAQNNDSSITLPAEVAYQCLESVPLVQDDATRLLDAWSVFLQWQSDPSYKAQPPSGYMYPGIDFQQAISDLRARVISGNITREIDLQDGIRDIVYMSHDGHMHFSTDFNTAIFWQRPIELVSVSSDGRSAPQVYITAEQQLSYVGRLNYTPSAIASIDGIPVEEYLDAHFEDLTQDPDAMFNAAMFSVEAPDYQGGGFAQPTRYPGPSTNLTFVNGTTQSFPNSAGTNADFTGVRDGATFYDRICNATRKIIEANTTGSGSAKTKIAKRHSSRRHLVEKQSSGGPQPVLSTDDGTLQFFRLGGSEELNKTAVMAMNSFTSTNVSQAQTLTRRFLKGCRENSIDHLVLDLTGNGGGDIIVAYDMMKQLFPSLMPYFMRDYRAQPATDALGQFFTNVTAAILVDAKGNRTATFGPPDGTNAWTDTVFVDRNGKRFSSWTFFYGPVSEHDDFRTKAFGFDISDTAWATEFADTGEPYAVTGFGFNAPAPPQTFAPENIIILGDGRCSSSCTTLAHFLKWSAKVKSIAMGGRPQLGPMQQQGGIKGGNVAGHSAIAAAANEIIQPANGSPEFAVKLANSTNLKPLVENAEYLKYRCRDADDTEQLSINLVNSVLANEAGNGNASLYADKETMPLQYIYEAADCRIFYTGQTANFRLAQWETAAYQAFGYNGTEVFSGCVEGSTGHPSSLSGDEKLFNGGKPVNVTGFNPPNTGNGPVDYKAFNMEGNRLKPYADSYVANITRTANATESGSGTSSGPAAATSSGEADALYLPCGGLLMTVLSVLIAVA